MKTLEIQSEDEDRQGRQGRQPKRRKSTSTQKFCEQCYRYDHHSPVKVALPIKVVLVVMTLGLALLFWPTRCVCCGSIRF